MATNMLKNKKKHSQSVTVKKRSNFTQPLHGVRVINEN